jgi:hypothetical protein
MTPGKRSAFLAKKSQRKRKQSSNKDNRNARSNDPWLSKRTGLIVMIILSIALAVYMIWQLYPGEGIAAIWWGLGFAASVWVVFGIFYLFNIFVRGKR